MDSLTQQRKVNRIIVAVSILVPVLVALLFYMPALRTDLDFSFLPKVHAAINATVALLLIAGMVSIRRKNMSAHRLCMMSAFSLSALFLLSYVIYHSTTDSTAYGGTGSVRSVYYFILLSHILLSAIILPLVLVTFSRALTRRFDRHKKIARWTFPIWLYVAVTGVIVYFMIAPYYGT